MWSSQRRRTGSDPGPHDERGAGGDATAVADGSAITAMGKLARNVPIATHVSEYVARLMIATHPEGDTAPTW